MNKTPSSSGQSASDDPPQKSDYNPHEKNLTRRDWNFLYYMAALGIIPLLVALVLCYVLFNYYPNFDNFPKGRAPLGPVDENVQHFPQEKSRP